LEQMEKVLSDTLGQMDICADVVTRPPHAFGSGRPVARLETLPPSAPVGCQGVPGAYSHISCGRFFKRPDIRFYGEFEDVFAAVARGEVAYGVLPVENSSAGAVGEVLALVSKYDLYINAATAIKVEHCLCARPDTDPQKIEQALSHPQALLQCAGFLREKGYMPVKYSNTAAAAKYVSESRDPLACLCSPLGADLYGLAVLKRSVQDYDENYTRFICVSKDNILLTGADTIALSLAFANEPGALGRLLTRFSVFGLDLTKLLSMPIASRDFNVRFFLDFRGSVEDPAVAALLGALSAEYTDFHFLGNYINLA
jgi:chorismate mutase/prephenate dehydratase